MTSSHFLYVCTSCSNICISSCSACHALHSWTDLTNCGCCSWVQYFYDWNYNPMLQMNNIRFSYTEKDQNLTQSEHSPREKQGVGRVLSRNGPFDEEQEQQITKKRTLNQGNSLHYSQIYSDIRIIRNQKIQPKEQQSMQQSRVANQSFTSNSYNKQESLNKSNALNAPKSLPQIMRDPRTANHLTPSRAIPNNIYNDIPLGIDNGQRFLRTKAFSISHYDIYRPGFLANRSSALSAKRQQEPARMEQPCSQEENNTIVKSEVQGQLQRELPQEELRIEFENEEDKDIPEVRIDQSMSKELSGEIKRSRVSEHNQEKSTGRKKIEEQYIEVKYESRAILKPELLDSQKRQIKQDVGQIQKEQLSKQPVAKSLSEFTLKQGIEIMRQQHKQPQLHVHIQEQETEERPLQASTMKPNNPLLVNKLNQSKIETIVNQIPLHAQIQGEQIQLQQPKTSSSQPIHPINPTTQKQPIAHEQQSLREKKQQQSYRPYEFHKFNVNDYMKIYEILRNIHTLLKNPLLDSHSLIREIKRYLQTVAGGSLDHIQGYDMPLHRLKIVKNALLFERIAIVIMCFAYSVGKLKDSLKFIINLVSYALNNTLLILKILQSSDLSKQSTKNPILAKSDRLILKKNYDTVRNNNDIILDSIFKISKYEQVFSESFKDILKSVGKNSLEQTFYNVLEYFAFFLCVSQLHMTLPFLAVAPNPYLRQTLDKRPTLVIDIVEIFCHGTRKSKSHVFRPHTEHFLQEMSQYYEIVSFTCAYPNQIDKVIDILDQKKCIKHRLYRHHAVWRNNILYKDTERIGRDLSRMILLDSCNNTIMGQSNNTIMIPVWRGNKNDTTLAQLCPLLAAIAIKKLDCIEATVKIHSQQIKNESAGIKYLNFGINLE